MCIVKCNGTYDGSASGVILIALFPPSSQLLTVYPEDNSLALVYRDKETLKFVKHVNQSSSSESAGSSTSRGFYDLSFVYYE